MDSIAAVEALGALSQATRLEAFRLLVKHEPEGLPAGDIARQLGIPANTMSNHLTILSRSGLVVSERHSRSIIYRANVASLRDLMLFLAKDCCGGREELCAPLAEQLACC